MITCFAVCARMRPKLDVSTFTPISSPTSASGSNALASSRLICAFLSVTSSTTSRNSNSSISPSSSLKRASISLSRPRSRLAAWRIASSSAAMISLGSIPLSFATWSISRFRPSIGWPPPRCTRSRAAPSALLVRIPRLRAREVGAREVVDPVSARHLAERDLERRPRRRARARSRPRSSRAGRGSAAGPSSGRRVSTLTSQPHAAAKSFSRASTRSRPGDDTSSRYERSISILGVEVRPHLARHVGAAIDRHAAVALRRVDRDPHQPRRTAAAHLDVDQLVAVRFHDRLDQCAQLRRNVAVHRVARLRSALDRAPKKRKADGAPTFQLGNARSSVPRCTRASLAAARSSRARGCARADSEIAGERGRERDSVL